MKIEHTETQVTSNIPQGNKKLMTISDDGMAHVMATLTKMYNDPMMAVIREYFTNGVDAHIEAGITAPVEVTLPTWDDPVYTVTDHGVGMSEWTIDNIYSQYGASTKRDSNDQNGAFGLGCKSAFNLTNQFTVISVKDGKKTTTLFARTEAGAYESNIVQRAVVEEANGTTVKIPVRERLNEFNIKAHQFFGFVAEGTALVDGAPPKTSFVNGRHIKDSGLDIYLKPKSEGASYVIMGTVPYELSTEQVREALASRLDQKVSQGFIRMVKYFTVPIGSVELTPNREGLMFTDKTNAVIDAHLTFILNDLKVIAQEEIDACITLDEIFDTHKRWDDIIPLPRHYKGELVPMRLDMTKPAHTVDRTSWGSIHHSDGHGLMLAPKTGYQTHGKKFLVSGYASDAYKKVNAYIGNYMTAKGLSEGTFVITDDEDLFTNKWVLRQNRFTILSGDDIIETGREQRKKDRLAAAKNGTKKEAIKYPVLFVDESMIKWVPSKEIESGTPYIDFSQVGGGVNQLIRKAYYSTRDLSVGSDTVSFFKSVTSAKKVVLLNASRTDKALADRIKKTYNLSVDVENAATVAQGMLTDDVKRHHSILSSGWRSFLKGSGLDTRVDDIKDPKVKEIIEPDAETVETYKKVLHMKRVTSYLHFFNIGSEKLGLDLDIDYDVMGDLDEKYPLITALNQYHVGSATDHVVKYLNMVHEESTNTVSV